MKTFWIRQKKKTVESSSMVTNTFWNFELSLFNNLQWIEMLRLSIWIECLYCDLNTNSFWSLFYCHISNRNAFSSTSTSRCGSTTTYRARGITNTSQSGYRWCMITNELKFYILYSNKIQNLWHFLIVISIRQTFSLISVVGKYSTYACIMRGGK